MGKLIEFKWPNPTIKQVTGQTPTENPHSGKKTTVSKAEFDAQLAKELTEEINTAKKTLESVLEFANDITDVLIMVRDVNGQMGFVTNVDGLTESIAFMERIKHRALALDAADPEDYNPGTGDVS